MGLFSDSHHFHSHDNSTRINYPDTVKVHEHKAPTDESIKLMEEMHDKALKNIIASVKVENNIVNGRCWVIEQPWCLDDIKLVFKFKINDHEFTVEKQVNRFQFYEHERDMMKLTNKTKSAAETFMLWYALKFLQVVAYEQITGEKFPEYLLK